VDEISWLFPEVKGIFPGYETSIIVLYDEQFYPRGVIFTEGNVTHGGKMIKLGIEKT